MDALDWLMVGVLATLVWLSIDADDEPGVVNNTGFWLRAAAVVINFAYAGIRY